MELTGISIYPVKSLSGISVQSALVEKAGLRHDRRLMVTDLAGVCLTQRDVPRMAALRLAIDGDGVVITSLKQDETLRISAKELSLKARRRGVEIWDDLCAAFDLGRKAAEWLSRELDRDCRLVVTDPASPRRRPTAAGAKSHVVSFADGYPFLVASESSLEELNSRMESPIGMERFRPNLVVSGSKPFSEDSWKRIRIGEAVFIVKKPCARCVVTTIDQAKGRSSGKEPLRSLSRFRKAGDVIPYEFESLGLNRNDVLFGVNLITESEGRTIRVGDDFEVLEFS